MGGTDDQLVPRAVAGDEAALTALLQLDGAQVRCALERSYHGRLADKVDLDDVMQITYLEAFLRIGHFVPTGPNAFRLWLQRIGENNLRDALRQSDARQRLRGGGLSTWYGDRCRTLLEPIARTDTPSAAARQDEVRRLLQSAMGRLPEDYERVLRLHDMDGRSGPEVARLIGRSHGAVKMLLARARGRLTELLGSRSKFLSGGG